MNLSADFHLKTVATLVVILFFVLLLGYIGSRQNG